jgi:hypothetical protein
MVLASVPGNSPAGSIEERLNANLKKLQVARAELEYQCASRLRQSTRIHEVSIDRLKRRLLALGTPTHRRSCTRS